MVSPDDYAWLITERGQSAWNAVISSRVVNSHSEPKRAAIREVANVDTPQADLLLEQLLLARGKARRKVQDPQRWFWTQKLFEQASDEWTAQETALDAPLHANRWYDVCCGAGVDAIALAKRKPSVIAVDSDPVAERLTHCNAWMNQVAIQSRNCPAESLDMDRDMFMNIDPDRRADGSRTIDPTRSQPAWSWVQQAVRRCGAVSLKLSPGLRTDRGFQWGDAIKPHAVRWLSWEGSVRQQRWYWGIERWPTGVKVASCGGKRSGWHHEIFDPWTNDSRSPAVIIDQMSRLDSGFVADQDPVVRAAGASDLLAEKLGVSCIGDRHGYFLGANAIDHPMLDWFRILDVVAMDSKRIRAMARSAKVAQWELKSRGVEVDLIDMQRQLHCDPASDQRRTLLFTRLGKQRLTIVAQRMERNCV
jgi:hypothetical protein